MSEPVDARTLYVAGNWKMHKLRADARAFAEALQARIDELDEVDLAIAPPFPSLTEVADILVPLGVGVLGQTAHAAPAGAFTGEVSMAMLADAGATGVLLGHSERRQLFGETDEALAEKVPAALAAGLEPILCVGETEAEREAHETEARLTTQVTRGLANVARASWPTSPWRTSRCGRSAPARRPRRSWRRPRTPTSAPCWRACSATRPRRRCGSSTGDR